ncbi:MAG: bifunctional adenosylcobinamide kinase/adenosylcobinamide-phosphate guanylyltransferase, partial [Actinomycetota bacterium]|nr:bifunctional adenosylcobinamide kinase/adenosylcobinamide-phosphate guanylyltransferase [Actinomycetota bacterium]
MAERIVVVGGTRSGKSAVAEQLLAAARQVVYVATGPASGDAETAERAATHRSRRPPAWTTVETTELLAAVRAAPPGAGILIDALGGWLGSRMSAHGLWAPADAEVAPLGPQGRD